MLSVRKVKTKSGSIAVQVVRYIGHTARIIKHIGSAKNKEEEIALKLKAREWISNYTGQLTLFPKSTQRVLFIDRGECIGVTHQFTNALINVA
jgi:hypothetical protein